MAVRACRTVLKRLLFIVPCIACLVMFAIDFTGKREIQSPADEGKAESTNPIIHNMYVVCDPQSLCDFSPCRNGGTCQPRTESDGTKSFVCFCTHGFGGKTCSNSKYTSSYSCEAWGLRAAVLFFKSSQRAAGKKYICSNLPARGESDTFPARSGRQELSPGRAFLPD